MTASSAFTATGLTNSAGATQFIGGTVSQTVTGATLSTIAYGFTTTANTAMDEITLTFAAAATDGQAVAVTVTGTGSGGWTCEDVGDTTTQVSTCTPTTSGNTYTAVTAISVTVS